MLRVAALGVLCSSLVVSPAQSLPTKQTIELCFIISGADEFGGHSGRMFGETITSTVYNIMKNFQSISETRELKVGALWTIPGSSPNHDHALSLTTTAAFQNELFAFMDKPPSIGTLSISSGFAEALDYAINRIFSKEKDIVKVAVAMTHADILSSEIAEFLGQKCRYVVVYALVFPYLPAKLSQCSNAEVHKTMNSFQKQIAKKARLLQRFNFSVCGFDNDGIDKIHKESVQVWPIVKRYAKYGCQVTTTSTVRPSPTPCPTLSNVELECVTPPPPPCEGVKCSLWIFGLAAFISLGVLSTAPIIIKSLYDQMRPRKRHPTLRMLLAKHYSSMHGQMRNLYNWETHMAEQLHRRHVERRRSVVTTQQLCVNAGDLLLQPDDERMQRPRQSLAGLTMNALSGTIPNPRRQSILSASSSNAPGRRRANKKAARVLGLQEAPVANGKAAKLLGLPANPVDPTSKAAKFFGLQDDVVAPGVKVHKSAKFKSNQQYGKATAAKSLADRRTTGWYKQKATSLPEDRRIDSSHTSLNSNLGRRT